MSLCVTWSGTDQTIILFLHMFFFSTGRERSLIANDLKSLQDQIGDLAFNNYRTYADAGRTTQHCTEIVSSSHSTPSPFTPLVFYLCNLM